MDFVQKHAFNYKDANLALLPWFAFAADTVKLFHKINHPIVCSDHAMTYRSSVDVAKTIRDGEPLKVWGGGSFADNHPMKQVDPKSGYCIYVLARAVHDYIVHCKYGFTFEPAGELYGALKSRRYYSELAQSALWTDDVAMGCVYAHFGEWPKKQRPIICEPDWEGLKEFLSGWEREGKQ